MYVGIDFGGTKTLVVAFDADGSEVTRERYPTNHEYPLFCNELFAAIDRCVPSGHIDQIVMAVPGMIDYETNRVISFGNLDWTDVDIHERLMTKYETQVTIDNDANLGAIGEANEGAGQGYDTQLYITISTGIGTGITYQGRVDRALRASEGGHMHFKHDGQLMIWEKFASGKAFYERYGKFGADVDDPEIWKEWAADVSIGMGSLMAVIQPDVIVIGGSMGEHLAKYKDHLIHFLQQTRSSVVRMPTIVAAKDPDNAVIRGCFVLADRLHND